MALDGWLVYAGRISGEFGALVLLGLIGWLHFAEEAAGRRAEQKADALAAQMHDLTGNLATLLKQNTQLNDHLQAALQQNTQLQEVVVELNKQLTEQVTRGSFGWAGGASR